MLSTNDLFPPDAADDAATAVRAHPSGMALPGCACAACGLGWTAAAFAPDRPRAWLNAGERGETGPNAKPSLTIAEAAVQLTRDTNSWNGATLGQPATVTYGFRATAPMTMPLETAGFLPFTAAQIAMAELVLQGWADVANISFVRVGAGTTGTDAYTDTAQMLFGVYSSGFEGAAAFAYYPSGNAELGGDSWYRADYLGPNANQGFARMILAHEIGHTLGLAHPGEYDASDGTPTYAADATYYEDTRQYSVMSYWSETLTGAAFSGGYAGGPLLDDIAAVQRLYGANLATRTGDTVYGFNSNTGRDLYSATGTSSRLVFAAWDGGGTDTFDFSGYAQAQRIDLNAGNFSDVGGLTGNVSIAVGVTIENAVGGSGADTIVGNAAANRLTGGGGADRLTGGAGADTFVYALGDSPSAGRDVVTDFTRGEDLLHLLAAGGTRFIGEGSFAGIAGEVHAVVSGTTTLVEVDRDGDRVVDLQLELTGALALTATDFVGLWNAPPIGTAGADVLPGTSGDDLLDGLAGNDSFELAGGGTDWALGGEGSDVFLFGAFYDAADRVDGGAGADVLAIQGNYVLTLGAGSLVGVETLTPLSGSDARFGDAANNRYDYRLTTVDANVAAGELLKVNAAQLLAGEDFAFDGSAETDGSFFLYGGLGVDTLTGGAGADVFFLAEGRFNAGDRFAGGAGADIVVLRGSVTASFGADTFTGIETVTLMSASDNRFFTGGTANSYAIVSHDGNVAAGATMTVNGGALRADEAMRFDGGAELNGQFRLFGGAAGDSLRGGAGADLLYGGLGADQLWGGAGNDVFRYQGTAESTAAARDTIGDFATGDRVDLARIDAIVGTPGDEAFSFIGASSFTGTAGQLRAVADAGGWRVEADTDGNGTADLSILVTVTDGHPLSAADFVL